MDSEFILIVLKISTLCFSVKKKEELRKCQDIISVATKNTYMWFYISIAFLHKLSPR